MNYWWIYWIFLEKILHKFKEEGNQVYALDYNRDGSKFATGGKDCQVIIWNWYKL